MIVNKNLHNIAKGKVFRKSNTKQEAELNLKNLAKKINSSNLVLDYPMSDYKNKDLFIKDLNFFNQDNKLLKKNEYKPSLHIESEKLLPSKPKNYTLRYIPTSIKVFLNSVYSFNKSYVKNLPQADNIVYKIIKSYFTLKFLSDNKQGKTSKLLARRYKKLSLNKIIVSKPEIKHSADNVMITVYVYNKKKQSVIYRLKKLYNSIITGNQKNNQKSKKYKNNMPLKFLNFLGFKAEKKNNKILNLLEKKRFFLHDKSKTCSSSKVNMINMKDNSKKTNVKQNFKPLNKAFYMQKKNQTLAITSKLRYNLKMNYLLDQDRDFISSLRGLNYAKKKIYIVLRKKIIFYKIALNYKNKILEYQTKINKYQDNLKQLKEKNSLVILKAMHIKKLIKKNKLSRIISRKINLKANSIKQKNFIVIDLLSIKQRKKNYKVQFNLEKYRHIHLKYVNLKKRASLLSKKDISLSLKRKLILKINKFFFNPLKLKKKSKRVNRIKKNLFINLKRRKINQRKRIIADLKRLKQKKSNLKFNKKYNNAIKYKNVKKIILQNLPMQNLAVIRKPEFKPNLIVKKNEKKFIPNRLTRYKTTNKNLHIINNFYKPIKIFNEKQPKRLFKLNTKKMVLNRGIALKSKNKYISFIKNKYIYKSNKWAINNKGNLYWLNILKTLDIDYNIKTKKFNNYLNKFLNKHNFNSLYVKRNLITQLVSSDYAYIKNLLKAILLERLILQREMLYIYYVRSLYINNIVFKTGFINSLINIISKVYNKKVKLNIVSLKYLFFNSDIFTQAITTRLKNHRRNRLNKVFNKVLGLVYLAKINEYAYNIHSPIYKYINMFNNKYKILRNNLGFNINTKHSKFKTNAKKQNNLNLLNGLPLYNLNHFLYNQINFIKCKSVFGIKLQASGRLSKRNTASRKIFKVKYLGNLRFNNVLNSNDSSYIIKNNIISNIQFSKIAGKTRIGSFGIKGWINNN